MRRREFIAGLGSAAARPLVARAQQRTMPVIGYLSVGPPELSAPVVASFLAGLAETGYVEGRNFVLEVSSTEDNDRLPALAADLVRRRVAMIFAASAPPTFAAKSATTVIPIVSAMGGADPGREHHRRNCSHPRIDREAHRTAARDCTSSHNDRLPPRSNWRNHRGANERRGGRFTGSRRAIGDLKYKHQAKSRPFSQH